MRNIKSYTMVLESLSDLNWKLWNEVVKDDRANLGVIKDIIESGANPNTPMPSGERPLVYAVRMNLLPLINTLIDAGADMSTYGDYTDNILYVAGFYDKQAAFDLLVKKGADLNEKNPKDKRTLLNSTIDNGQHRISRMLINAGANVDESDPISGSTPLMKAIQWPSVELAESIISKGANLEAQNLMDRTAMWWARETEKENWLFLDQEGSKPLTKLLIANGANPFTAFSDINDIASYFNGDIDWMPEGPLKTKLMRMKRGKRAFGM